MIIFTVLATALSLITFTNAYSHLDGPNTINRGMHLPNPADSTDALIQTVLGNSTFTQLIDHNNPSLGTFEQFYYYTSQYWAGPGSPILLFTPGEVNVTGYQSYATTNRTSGVLAQKLGAAVVVLEHRYWGTSSPYAELSTENLQYLTLENSIKDFVRFAETAKLPFAPQGGANATTAPWIFIGGSYSGALAAWIESIAGGTFWAYWSSSAPVNAMDYWQYFVPIQQGMPKNCSADITRVIEHIDEVGLNGTVEEQKALKTMFGFGDLEHYDDFAAALENGPWLWQGNQFYSNTGFFSFCDTIEGVQSTGARNVTITNSPLPPETGVGLQLALQGYAKWTVETFIPGFCDSYGYPEFAGENNTACFDTYNPKNPYYTDWSLSNAFDRQWVWMTCNEPFGYWQDAAPPGRPSLVSRLVDQKYWERQCALFFPPSPNGMTYGIAAGRTFDALNNHTGGWFIDNSTRLLYVNGEFDPWREASVSSDFRPGGPLVGTETVPVLVLPGGFHASDLVTANAGVNEGARLVIEEGMRVMEGWVGEWKVRNGTVRANVR